MQIRCFFTINIIYGNLLPTLDIYILYKYQKVSQTPVIEICKLGA